jgi:hypothetical protein
MSEVDQVDRGWSGMSHAGVTGLLDLVAVVAAAFDLARVGAVTALGVQVSGVGDLVVELGDQVGQAVRGKTPRDR